MQLGFVIRQRMMRQKNTEITQLVIPIAGAGNVGCEIISTAAFHMKPLLSALGSVAGRHVTAPVIPEHFGIGDLDHAAERVCNKIQEKISEHPDAEVVLAGHSLGGLTAAYAAFTDPSSIRGIVTLGTPLGELRRLLPIPSYYRDKYAEFARHVLELQSEDSPQVVSLGSRLDEFVTLPSAHAIENAEHVTTGWQSHNMLVVAPRPIMLTRHAVDALLEAGEISTQTPAPNELSIFSRSA